MLTLQFRTSGTTWTPSSWGCCSRSAKLTGMVVHDSASPGQVTSSLTQYKIFLTRRVELETKVKRGFPKISQSRRRPLQGPSPGCKRLLALSHLRGRAAAGHLQEPARARQAAGEQEGGRDEGCQRAQQRGGEAADLPQRGHQQQPPQACGGVPSPQRSCGCELQVAARDVQWQGAGSVHHGAGGDPGGGGGVPGGALQLRAAAPLLLQPLPPLPRPAAGLRVLSRVHPASILQVIFKKSFPLQKHNIAYYWCLQRPVSGRGLRQLPQARVQEQT